MTFYQKYYFFKNIYIHRLLTYLPLFKIDIQVL